MRLRSIDLLRGDSSDVAAGKLVSGLDAEHLDLVERAWSSTRADLMMNLTLGNVASERWPQSLHWDWSRKAPALKLLEVSGVGITCKSEWQGIMLTHTAQEVARLGVDRGKPIVYVEFLETAPWNWRIDDVGQRPRFRGVGSLLLREAVRQSIREGFRGRVGLHALPQSESFYERICGMTRLDADAKKLNLVYFELSQADAPKFLKEGVRR